MNYKKPINSEFHWTSARKRFSALLLYLPAVSILEWLEQGNWVVAKEIGREVIIQRRRYELVLPALEHQLMGPGWAFEILLADNHCPLRVLAAVSQKYDPRKTRKIAYLNDSSFKIAKKLLKAAAASVLSVSQVLQRTILLEKYLEIGYNDKMSIAVANNSIAQVCYYINTASVDIIQHRFNSILTYPVFLTPDMTGYNIGKIVVTSYTDAMFASQLQTWFKFDIGSASRDKKSFYTAFLEDPRLSRERLIAEIIPKIVKNANHRESGESYVSQWIRLGVDLTVFLDSRLTKYLSREDIYDMLTIYTKTFPYSSSIDSPFFTLLTYIPTYRVRVNYISSPDGSLAHLEKHEPRLATDKVLLRNLVKNGNFFIVTVILRNILPQDWAGNHPYLNELVQLGSAKSRTTASARQKTAKRLLELIDG